MRRSRLVSIVVALTATLVMSLLGSALASVAAPKPTGSSPVSTTPEVPVRAQWQRHHGARHLQARQEIRRRQR